MAEKSKDNRTDITDWIQSYEESCRLVRGRIADLTKEIAGLPENQQQKSLISRRYTLYSELWDMQRTIRTLREYVHPPASRQHIAGG